jgi:hypothetical protein
MTPTRLPRTRIRFALRRCRIIEHVVQDVELTERVERPVVPVPRSVPSIKLSSATADHDDVVIDERDLVGRLGPARPRSPCPACSANRIGVTDAATPPRRRERGHGLRACVS